MAAGCSGEAPAPALPQDPKPVETLEVQLQPGEVRPVEAETPATKPGEAETSHDFPRVEALVLDLEEQRSAATPDQALELLARACEVLLPWCGDPRHGAAASDLLGHFAVERANLLHDHAGDPGAAREVAEQAWVHRERMQFRACLLSLLLADLRRGDKDWQGSQEALDFYRALARSPDCAAWRADDDYGPHVLLYDVLVHCRQAMLDLALGNPDEALRQIRAADRNLALNVRKIGATPMEFLRIRLDYFLGTENFARVVALADEILAHEVPEEAASIFRLYRAVARSVDPVVDADPGHPVWTELAGLARSGIPDLRRLSCVRLIEHALARGELARAEEFLGVAAGDRPQDPAQDPQLTTLASQVLLARHAGDESDEARQARATQLPRQEAAFESLIGEWQSIPVRPGGVGFLHFLFRRDVVARLVELQLAADPSERGVAAALARVAAAQVHGSLSQRLDVRAPSLARIREHLGADHGVLLFLPTRNTISVFALDRARVRHFDLPVGALAIRPHIDAFLTGLRALPDPGAAQTGDDTAPAIVLWARGQALAGVLVPPPLRALLPWMERHSAAVAERAHRAAALRATGRAIARLLLPEDLRDWIDPHSALTVIGAELLLGPVAGTEEAGFLNFLPLECLPWDDERLLGQRFAVDQNASLPLWTRLAGGPRAGQQPVQLDVFGTLRDPDAEPNPEDRLPAAAFERMGAALGQTRLHLDDRCTTDGLRGLAGSRGVFDPGSALLFVGHGSYDERRVRGAQVQFWDGPLGCEAVETLGLPGEPLADLVVLAACRTGRGPTRAGDSLANLGGAFLMAGATTVVQSRFDLPLHRTLVLLEDAFAGLARGASPAEAFRTARAAPRNRQDPLNEFRTGILQVHGYGQGRRPR